MVCSCKPEGAGGNISFMAHRSKLVYAIPPIPPRIMYPWRPRPVLTQCTTYQGQPDLFWYWPVNLPGFEPVGERDVAESNDDSGRS